MADVTLQRRGAFDSLAARTSPLAAAQLIPCAPCAAFVFRGRSPSVLDAANAAFGVGLPLAPCTSATIGERSALWLGPDEWLLLAPEAEAAAIADAFGAITEPHSLVAVGERNTGLEISGPRAADVLSAGCALDLHLARFPVGTCTRTLFGKAEIVLWRLDADRFYVGTWRSFAAYVWELMIQASLEYEV